MTTALIDRLDELHFDLKKVQGTLATIVQAGDGEKQLGEPLHLDELLSMLQLMEDVVTPVCREMGEIVEELYDEDDKERAARRPQIQKARAKKKGR